MQSVQGDRAIRNDDWISEEKIPDPTPLPTIPGYKVLVRPVAIRAVTKGGIILTQHTTDDLKYLTTVGRVLAVGKAAYTDHDRYPVGPWCKPGDIVAYGRNSGTKFLYKGVRVLLLFEDQIEMVLENPGDIDPMYNIVV